MGEPTPRHASPFYCPYCGEEEIRPWGENAGEWRCELCRRVWRLGYVGATGAVDGPEPAGRPDASDGPDIADGPDPADRADAADGVGSRATDSAKVHR